MHEQRPVMAEGSGPATPRVPGYEVFQRLDASAQWWGQRHGDERHVLLVCIHTHKWAVSTAQEALDGVANFSRLRHRHLLRVHDVVPDALDEQSKPCLVIATESAPGDSLAAALRSRGPLSFGEAVTALVPVGQGLTAMHEQGHVHGGLTPSVVLFTGEGMPLVAPAWMDETHRSSPLECNGVGVAPEVSEGFAATVSSDAYAYAAVMWQALTGEAPGWVGARADLEELAPDVPPELSRALSLALSPDPAERPGIDELLAHLRDLARPEPVALHGGDSTHDVPRRIRAAARAAGHISGRPRQHPGGHRRPHSARKASWAAALIVALIAGCAAAFNQLSAAPLKASPATTWAAGSVLVKADPPGAEMGGTAYDSGSMPEAMALGIVQGLLEARAGAWLSGDVGALEMAHAAGSPALAADVERLQAASVDGARLQAVTFTADNAVVLDRGADLTLPESVEATSTDPGALFGSFSMALTVRRQAVEVVNADGLPFVVPATSENVTLTVVKQGREWRLYEWH